jgi:hypothetical protein
VSAEPHEHGFIDQEQLKVFVAAKLAAIVVSSKRDNGKKE